MPIGFSCKPKHRMKSQTSNQIEESIYQYLLEKEVFSSDCVLHEEHYCPVDFLFFTCTFRFGLKPKEEIESEWEDNQGLLPCTG